jgi:hypothetical protein
MKVCAGGFDAGSSRFIQVQVGWISEMRNSSYNGDDALLLNRQRSLQVGQTLLWRYFWKLGRNLLITMANPPPDPTLETLQAFAYAKNVWRQTRHRRRLEAIPVLQDKIVERLNKTRALRTDKENNMCDAWRSKINESMQKASVALEVGLDPIMCWKVANLI